MKSWQKIFSFLLALLLFISTSFCVFAANLDYLSSEKWENNNRVSTVDVHKTSRENNLNGTFRYAVDNESLTVYTYLSFDESTLDGSDDIRVIYEFEMHDETYSFAINGDGVCEDSGDTQQTFETGQNFFYNGNTPQCISYAQYLGDSSGGNIRVFLYVNNSRYLIYENIGIELPTTTKAPTTTKKKVAKTTKKKTTKKAKTTAKTKIIYRNATTKKNASTTNKSTSTKTIKNGNVTVDTNVAESKLSAANKYLIIFAAVIGVVAALYIVYNMGKSNSKNKEENDE